MTDSQSALSEVPALVEERRRYESWLVALEGRRKSTPQHVFERVQTDYRTRLDRVAEKLSSYRAAIAEERATLQSRLSLIEAEEGHRRDERAELELRNHVGELIGLEADTAFGVVDQVLGRLGGERQGLVERIGELGMLLTESSAQPTPSRNGSARDMSSHPEKSARAHVTVSPGGATAPLRIRPQEGPAPQSAGQAAVAVEPSVEPALTLVTTPALPRLAPPKSEPAPQPPNATAVGPTGPTQMSTRPRGARNNFDELAFLSTVIGKNDVGAHAAAETAPVQVDEPFVERQGTEPLIKPPLEIVREETAIESRLTEAENAGTEMAEHPVAEDVASVTPIVRPSTALEQGKTLRCNECGGMNYPTEWYCERCGGELGAL